MTTFYPYGDQGEEVEISVRDVIRGLSRHYKTTRVRETVIAAYAGFNTPTAVRHLNGQVDDWIITLNEGEVPHFMAVMYFLRVRNMTLPHYAKVDGPL